MTDLAPQYTGPLFNHARSGKASGDFDGNGRVNSLDFNLLATEYGQHEINMSAPVFDATSSSGEILANTTSSHNHTVGSGSNRAIFIGVSMLSAAGVSVSAVTFNGVSATLVGTKASPVTGAVRCELWKLLAPASGSHAIAVTTSGSVNFVVNAVSYSNVNQTLLGGVTSDAATNGGAADATVDNAAVLQAGSGVIGLVATDDTSITASGHADRQNVSGTIGSAAMGDILDIGASGGGEAPIAWTNVGAGKTWAVLAVVCYSTDNYFLGTISDDDSVAGNWALGHVVTTGETAVIDSGADSFSTTPGTTHTRTMAGFREAEIVIAGMDLHLWTVNGNANVNNTFGSEIAIGAVRDDVTGSGSGDLTLYSKTGNGTITYSHSVIINDLGTSQVTFGSTAGTEAAINMLGSAGSKLIFTSTSMGGTPSISIDSGVVTEIDSDNVSVDLLGSTLNTAVTMVSTNGGHVTNYTQTLGGNSGDVIVTGGAMTARHVGDTITITLSGGRKGTFTPTLVKTASNEDELSGFSWNATTGVITGTVPAAWAGTTGAGLILNGNTGVEIDLPGFVTTAATVNRTTKSHIRSSVHI